MFELLKESEPRPEREQDPRGDDEELLSTSREIRCRRCGTGISQQKYVFSPTGGSSQFVFANPAGRVFEVLAVRRATALELFGEPTQEHTWFPGFAWRAGFCSGCGVHLGWCFDAVPGGTQFFALITSEIVEE